MFVYSVCVYNLSLLFVEAHNDKRLSNLKKKKKYPCPPSQYNTGTLYFLHAAIVEFSPLYICFLWSNLKCLLRYLSLYLRRLWFACCYSYCHPSWSGFSLSWPLLCHFRSYVNYFLPFSVDWRTSCWPSSVFEHTAVPGLFFQFSPVFSHSSSKRKFLAFVLACWATRLDRSVTCRVRFLSGLLIVVKMLYSHCISPLARR
jgi:hypothetical protein